MLFLAGLIYFTQIPLHAQEAIEPTTQQLLNPTWVETQLAEIGIEKLITRSVISHQ